MSLAPITNNSIVGDTERMIDGTLFKLVYEHAYAQYCITSHTPVEGHQPLRIHTYIERADATKFREQNWLKGYTIDSTAFHLGIEELQASIPIAVRKLREGELIEVELEQLEGFGSF